MTSPAINESFDSAIDVEEEKPVEEAIDEVRGLDKYWIVRATLMIIITKTIERSLLTWQDLITDWYSGHVI